MKYNEHDLWILDHKKQNLKYPKFDLYIKKDFETETVFTKLFTVYCKENQLAEHLPKCSVFGKQKRRITLHGIMLKQVIAIKNKTSELMAG